MISFLSPGMIAFLLLKLFIEVFNLLIESKEESLKFSS
jgi:hypothetical protein